MKHLFKIVGNAIEWKPCIDHGTHYVCETKVVKYEWVDSGGVYFTTYKKAEFQRSKK